MQENWPSPGLCGTSAVLQITSVAINHQVLLMGTGQISVLLVLLEVQQQCTLSASRLTATMTSENKTRSLLFSYTLQKENKLGSGGIHIWSAQPRLTVLVPEIFEISLSRLPGPELSLQSQLSS